MCAYKVTTLRLSATSMQWGALNPPCATNLPKVFGCAVCKMRFGSLLAIYLVSSILRQTKAPDSLMRELSGSLNLAYFLRLLTYLVLLRLTCLHADLTTSFQNMFLGNLTLGPAMWTLFRFPGVGCLFTSFLPFLCLIDVCRNWRTIRLQHC